MWSNVFTKLEEDGGEIRLTITVSSKLISRPQPEGIE